MNFLTYKDGFIKSNVKLSVGIIVSNHIQYIEKCMEALQPLLKAVDSELVILDTVGPENSDGSIEICRKYTDKIYRFEWVNDFSTARNALLSHCVGEWFMYQDDDEWFDNLDEMINFFNSNAYHKFNSGFYYTKDYTPDGGSSMGIAGRMIRRKPNSHFVGRVHENFNEANVPGKMFSCFTHHQGYLFTSEEEKRKKRKRNLSLLEADIAELGIAPNRCAQHVQELLNFAETREKAYELSVFYADELVKLGYESSNCTQWVICAQLRYFLINQDGEGIVKKAAEIRSKYKLSHYARLVLSEIEVDGITHYLGIPPYLSLLAEDVKDYIAIDQYFSKHEEEKLIETQLDFPRFYTEERKNAMLAAGAQVANYMGDSKLAYEYWKKVCWEIEEEPWKYKESILCTLQNCSASEPLAEYYQRFMNAWIFDLGNEKYLPRDLRNKIECSK